MTNRKSSTISVSLVKILKSYANRFGIDFNTVAKSSGLELAVLENGEARIPAHMFNALWQNSVAVSKDPCPGLHFGQEMTRHYPGGSLLFTMMLNCKTLGDAVTVFVRYHRIMADVIQPVVEKQVDHVHLSWEVFDPELVAHPHLSEALICTFFSILNYLAQDSLIPANVCFTHADPEDADAYRQIFKTPVKFGMEKNELILEAKDLGIRIELANPELYGFLENHAARISHKLDETIVSARVLHMISSMIFKGLQPDLDLISKEMAMSRRSLQEKLKAEKTNFRKIDATARMQIALDQLSKPETAIFDVAFLLGYSDQSAFNHAFKRWTGKTPNEYKTQAKPYRIV
ncbi:MAG: AraC family transcriptional regulator [Desulfobacteraceae bacterium]|jgi:AraC-like DNA-binding protein